MPYCVIRKDVADAASYKVQSKHRTKSAAKKRAGRRNRRGFVVKCPVGARKGTRLIGVKCSTDARKCVYES